MFSVGKIGLKAIEFNKALIIIIIILVAFYMYRSSGNGLDDDQAYRLSNWEIDLIKWIHPKYLSLLTHWGRDKMAVIFRTTIQNVFSWMKIYEFRLKISLKVLRLFYEREWFSKET